MSIKNKGKCAQFIENISLKNAFSEFWDATRGVAILTKVGTFQFSFIYIL